MFRLELDEAVINRYGFNSDGAQVAQERLIQRKSEFLSWNSIESPDLKNLPQSLSPGHLLGVNLGKNKWSPQESAEDYVKGVQTFAPFADYLVINISSPNTPGLRSMQRKEILKNLISEV